MADHVNGNGAGGKLQAEWFWGDRWTTSRGFLLPMGARGLYREMLTQAWRRGSKLPRNPRELRAITAATPAEWRRYWPMVRPFWRVEGDSLVNDTQLAIYAEATKRAAGVVARARAGARARWRDASSNA